MLRRGGSTTAACVLATNNRGTILRATALDKMDAMMIVFLEDCCVLAVRLVYENEPATIAAVIFNASVRVNVCASFFEDPKKRD